MVTSGSSTLNALHPLTIPTLAVVKVNWDERHDYIQNFVPLIAHSLAQNPEEAISLSEVQSRVQADWGLTIPQAALKANSRSCQAGRSGEERTRSLQEEL